MPPRASSIHSLLNPAPEPSSHPSPSRSDTFSLPSPSNRQDRLGGGGGGDSMDVDGPSFQSGPSSASTSRRTGMSKYGTIPEDEEVTITHVTRPHNHKNGASSSTPNLHFSSSIPSSSSNITLPPIRSPSRQSFSPTPSTSLRRSVQPQSPKTTKPLSSKFEGADGCVFVKEPIIGSLTKFLALGICKQVYDLVGGRDKDVNWETGELPGGLGYLEIEAKLGLIIDKNTNQRLRLPVLTETVLASDDPNFSSSIRFQSSIPFPDHTNLYCHLNQALRDGMAKDKLAPPAEATRTFKRFGWNRTVTEDEFWTVGGGGGEGGKYGGGKLRVSRDESGKIIPGSMIEKRKLIDWDVYCPQSELDFRVSLSLEKPLAQFPPNSYPSPHRRRKNRTSYIHQTNQIDLTEVFTGDQQPHYEVEIEMTNMGYFIENTYAWLSDQENVYRSLIQYMLNNLHALQNRTWDRAKHPDAVAMLTKTMGLQQASRSEDWTRRG